MKTTWCIQGYFWKHIPICVNAWPQCGLKQRLRHDRAENMKRSWLAKDMQLVTLPWLSHLQTDTHTHAHTNREGQEWLVRHEVTEDADARLPHCDLSKQVFGYNMRILTQILTKFHINVEQDDLIIKGQLYCSIILRVSIFCVASLSMCMRNQSFWMYSFAAGYLNHCSPPQVPWFCWYW